MQAFPSYSPLKYASNVLDLHLTSEGHSRLKPMAAFERACKFAVHYLSNGPEDFGSDDIYEVPRP